MLNDPTQSSVYTPRNLHWWSDWTFTCCKTVKDPYCLLTVLMAIAIQRFALFTYLEILHGIWSFDSWEIFKFVGNRCNSLRLKCTKFNFGWGPWRSLQRSPGLLAAFKGGREERVENGNVIRGEDGRNERGKSMGPKGWFTHPCPKSWKIPWLQNWSDWRWQHHRRLPRAANTLTLPLYRKSVCRL